MTGGPIPGSIPYPFTMRTRSVQTIVGIRRLEETLQRAEGDGDNWHMTWARDNKQYIVLGDGKGWPDAEGHTGPTYHTRVYGLNLSLIHI